MDGSKNRYPQWSVLFQPFYAFRFSERKLCVLTTILSILIPWLQETPGRGGGDMPVNVGKLHYALFGPVVKYHVLPQEWKAFLIFPRGRRSQDNWVSWESPDSGCYRITSYIVWRTPITTVPMVSGSISRKIRDRAVWKRNNLLSIEQVLYSYVSGTSAVF